MPTDIEMPTSIRDDLEVTAPVLSGAADQGEQGVPNRTAELGFLFLCPQQGR